eukprot:c19614_g1_i1.p1 GENE.c19614_g1_i1~~c19614_g1_i1.p1  ORF type:complete len:494 (-),score=187.92 c19614_g1_i1:10-1461(-)
MTDKGTLPRNERKKSAATIQNSEENKKSEKKEEKKSKVLIGEKDNSKRVVKKAPKTPITIIGAPIGLQIEEVSVESQEKFFKTICVDTRLYERLQEAGKNGMIVLEIFNPPDALDSGAGVTHSRLQLFLKPSGEAGPVLFKYNEYLTKDDIIFNGTIPQNQIYETDHPINSILKKSAKEGFSLAAIYQPIRTSGEILFIFQIPYAIYSASRPKLDSVCISLHCAARTGESPQILELTPTLYDLGNQGYRLACAYNPSVSRVRQANNQPSIIHFFFEKEYSSDIERYATSVVRCQMWVTDVAFGVRVTGQYLKDIRRHSDAGWNLVSVIDVADCSVAGLTTVFLIFQAPAKKIIFEEKSEIKKDFQLEVIGANGMRSDSGSISVQSRFKRHMSKLSILKKDNPRRGSSSQGRRLSGGQKKEQPVEKTEIKTETKSRLFNEEGSGPTPSFVYAHNNPELQEQKIKRKEREKERGCSLFSCLGLSE